jgi:hypothetical protein
MTQMHKHEIHEQMEPLQEKVVEMITQSEEENNNMA